jgi:integrase/recombinase XerD
MLISAAFDQYILDAKLNGCSPKTVKNTITAKNSFVKACGDVPATFLTFQHVMQWKVDLDQNNKSDSTIKGYLGCLRNVIKFLHKHGVTVMDFRDIELPKVKKKQKDHVTPTEARRMVDYAQRNRDKALIATLWSSGCRISEVLALNRDALEDPKPYVVGKGSKQVLVQLDDTARKCIQAYLVERRDKLPALFISGQMRRLTVQRAEQIVNQISGELDIRRPDGIEKHITPHAFRRGYATDLHLNGADIVEVQQALHHSSITTTRQYIIPDEKRKDEAYRKYHSAI